MDSNPHETRPLKRRRMEMALPDGFSTTATTARKPVYKPVVPRFSSAFNGDRAFDLTSTASGNFKPSSSNKESTDNLKECRLVLSKSSIVDGADNLKVLHAPVPGTRTFTPRTPKERPSTFLPALHGSLISSQLKTDGPILQLRPPPKPPITMPSYHKPISTSALLKPAVPPPPLLAIFLHDQHPDITLPNSHPDDHDGRGLGLSPEKMSKRRSSKLVRGGLAARASAFFEQSQTSLVLWQKETERRANALSSSDLRVNIIMILQKPLPSGPNLISPGIALCRIRRETNIATHKSYNIDDLYWIVFSFSSCLTKSIFNDPLRFLEGRTVRICCPWQEISFTAEPSLPATSSLPLPSEPNVAINNKTLLCSRFFIL